MQKLLFLDLETFPEEEFKNLTTQKQEAFEHHYYSKEEEDDGLGDIEQQFKRKAGLMPEFGKIICASIGYERDDGSFKTKCAKGKDEGPILDMLDNIAEPMQLADYGIAGWNINNFDIPFIAKRFILTDNFVPPFYNTLGIKPWESKNVDVMDLWKCGGWGRATSLEVACAALNIPVKFTEHTGVNIWEQNIDDINWDEMEMYCNNDIYSAWCIYKKLQAVAYIE